ncbi:hypothetical protein, partial [Tenacibaculum finnmarkense]|uniref:hypothetical protein n=1 Tax=Tenacibaculum finnmarkense TaxID=2781243 RepID=UPI001EFA932E
NYNSTNLYPISSSDFFKRNKRHTKISSASHQKENYGRKNSKLHKITAVSSSDFFPSKNCIENFLVIKITKIDKNDQKKARN